MPTTSSLPARSNSTSVDSETIHTLHIVRDRLIAATPEIVWETLLEKLGPAAGMPESPMPMKVEPWPGGRWFRDLGDGKGHHWGHVQVIKPPTLLEICGPLFMSYPAISHVQYRLTPTGNRATLKLIHRAMGLITQEHHTGVQTGWNENLDWIKTRSEQLAAD
ncbi:MAG: SRPBCC domain-containing protein [Phycisphaeraceae bacterium]|nr:SRPBCC domain-containing protein [Phycisphaeraceae bacterium]